MLYLGLMKKTTIYCDGSAIGNPGPGGWGAVVLTPTGDVHEYGGFAEHTTNNRMELTAPTEALKSIDTKSSVIIKTDSQYVINGITKWVFGWEKNGWQTKEKKDVLNKELWQALLVATRDHTVEWEHVRGHVGIDLNERVDVIANGYARKENVSLYAGTEKEYKEFLKGMPKARKVASSSSKNRKAYSYVSAIDGKVEIHTTWAACEKRVKGHKAQFKKVYSAEEEKDLITQWSS